MLHDVNSALLAVQDDHPLAAELASLRAAVEKYQVRLAIFILVSNSAYALLELARVSHGRR